MLTTNLLKSALIASTLTVASATMSPAFAGSIAEPKAPATCYEANGIDWKYDPVTKLDCHGYKFDGTRTDGGAVYGDHPSVIIPKPVKDTLCYDGAGAWKYDSKMLDCNGYLPDGNRLDGGPKYDPTKYTPGMPTPEKPTKKPMRGNRCMESMIGGDVLKFKLKACVKLPKAAPDWSKMPKKDGPS